MADGRRREAWNHTSHLLALIYNMNRSSQSKAMTPQEFHPMHGDPSAEKPRQKVPISALRDVFLRDRTAKHQPRDK
jgi:hypothetical protein